MRKTLTTLTLAAAALALSACAAATPLPQDTSTTTGDPATSKVSTCDAAREAILTGTPAAIDKAMKALVADKAADATAREAAQDYLKTKDKDLKSMHSDLVQLACSV